MISIDVKQRLEKKRSCGTAIKNFAHSNKVYIRMQLT